MLTTMGSRPFRHRGYTSSSSQVPGIKSTMLTTRFRKNDQTFFVSSTTHRRHLKLNMIIVLLTIYLIVFLPHLLLKPFKRQQTFKSDHMFSHFCHTNGSIRAGRERYSDLVTCLSPFRALKVRFLPAAQSSQISCSKIPIHDAYYVYYHSRKIYLHRSAKIGGIGGCHRGFGWPHWTTHRCF